MNFVDRKNNLLSRFTSKEITIEQFLLECALWSLETECMVDYEVRDYPLIPKEYQEYLDLPFEKRIKIPPEFFHQPSIKEYIALRSSVYSQNYAEYTWIKECKRIIPDSQQYLEQHLKLDKKLYEYRLWFNNYSPELTRAKEVFEAEEV